MVLPTKEVSALYPEERQHAIATLNVAGPRESTRPGAAAYARALITAALKLASGGLPAA